MNRELYEKHQGDVNAAFVDVYNTKTIYPYPTFWQGAYDKDGKTLYGSFTLLKSIDELKNRNYELRWMDYKPAIVFTDVFYDTKTMNYISR